MAHNLPENGTKKLSLHKTLKNCLQHLASGNLKKHNLHHLYAFKKYWHWTALNIMGSVTKLVRDHKDVNKMKMVDITIQKGQEEAASDSLALLENQNPATAPSFFPSSSPSPTPKEKGEGRGKQGKEEKYIERENTGKEKVMTS